MFRGRIVGTPRRRRPWPKECQRACLGKVSLAWSMSITSRMCFTGVGLRIWQTSGQTLLLELDRKVVARRTLFTPSYHSYIHHAIHEQIIPASFSIPLAHGFPCTTQHIAFGTYSKVITAPHQRCPFRFPHTCRILFWTVSFRALRGYERRHCTQSLNGLPLPFYGFVSC